MKMFKRIAALALMLMLCLSVLPAQAASMTFYSLGSTVNDFTLTTADGKTLTLSEILKEKDMVLLNLFATWCGPCEMEFPFLQAAYTQYQDEVEVIAVSSSDTDEGLLSYAKEHGLTFPVARDTANLSLQFYAMSVPTSVVIDRFGTACFIRAGAMDNVEDFTRLFDAFVGDGYTTSQLLTDIPSARPNIPVTEVTRLAEALNPALSFSNPTYAYTWPMIAAEDGDRLCVMSTNAGVKSSESAVYAQVEAKAGDAIAVTFKLSGEFAGDIFQMTLNGETVKRFTGEKDWMTYAHPVTADGAYTVGLHYLKDEDGNAGEDRVYIDALEVLTGDAAAAALAANPAYPVADATALTITTPGARKILFDDPTYVLMSMFGLAEYYIVPGGEVSLTATLAESVDPDMAFIVNHYDSTLNSILAFATADGYAFTTKLDSADVTGYPYTVVQLVPAPDAMLADVKTLVLFSSEENAGSFLELAQAAGLTITEWDYADAPSTISVEGNVRYTFRFQDEAGNPVGGVIANVCTETTCTPYTATEAGIISFEAAPEAYDVHIIKVPGGYAYDDSQNYVTDIGGGEAVFTLTKAE